MERKLLGFPAQTPFSPSSHNQDTSQLLFNLGWASREEDLSEVVPILLALRLLRLSFQRETDRVKSV